MSKKHKVRTRTIALYSPELEDALEELQAKWAAAVAAAQQSPARESDSGPTPNDHMAEWNRLASEADQRPDTTHVVVKRIPNWDFEDLIDENPPREGNKRDADVGFNRREVETGLLRQAIVSPKRTDAEFDEWVSTCERVHWRRIFEETWELNERAVDLPNQQVSAALRDALASETLQPPERA